MSSEISTTTNSRTAKRTMDIKWTALAYVCCCSWTLVADAGLQVDSLFSDQVVLQRRMRVPVWGTASAGTAVEVSFADQCVGATADEQGNWMAFLEPLAASSQGRPMTVTGGETSVTIHDVVVGEVWIGAGQSNMALTMRESDDGQTAIASANHQMLRLFKRPAEPGRQRTRWVSCTPREVEDFSAVAYFFGKHLLERLDTPVGLIVRAAGGTTIQRWVPPGSEQRSDVLAAYVAEARRREADFARFDAERVKYDKRNRPPPEMADWLATMANLSYYRHPTGGLYRRMIRPLQPFAVRGVVWYQGEFNNRPGQAYDYRHWLPVLIDGWRRDWEQETLPFLFVQMQVLGNATTPLLRESQLMTLERCPNTAMAVICDESTGLHPPRKKVAADRLAMAARSLVYGEEFPHSGPTLQHLKVVDGKAVLTFEHVGDGLQCKDNVLSGFFICGDDREFRPAEARIVGPNQVTVWRAGIETPAAVRYAWLNDPRETMSLYNSAGLPASPFRTDAYDEVSPMDKLISEVAATDRVIHPRWAPKVIDLKHDGVTTIMGYRAELHGHLTHQPMPENEFYVKPEVYGFVDDRDQLVFSVTAPAAGSYAVAALCNARRDLLEPITVEVSCDQTRLVAGPQHAKTPDGPSRLTFQRLRFPGTLPLQAGVNRIKLRLSSVPHEQSEMARTDLTRRAIPSRDTSFRVWSIELAQPAVLDDLRRRALESRSDIDWMIEGQYGLFTHWSPLCYPLYGEVQTGERYQQAVDEFDVDAYVEMVRQTGAAWVVFTTSHGQHYWPGPNKTIDQILPGRTCRRDLIGELAEALVRYDIRLMLYYHTGCGDQPWAEAVGLLDADPHRYFDNVVALHEEASRRYGGRLASTGVYIDTSPRVLYQLDFPYECLTRAIKSGNPQAIVGYSTDRLPRLTYFADIASQDAADWLGPPMPDAWFGPGRAYEGLQRSRFFFMDDWIPRKPYRGHFPPPCHAASDYVTFFQQMATRRVPVTVNLMITQDVQRGQPFVSPRSMAIMQEVRRTK